jgi:hypothetical protein
MTPLRCRQGDLALIVDGDGAAGSGVRNIGKLVTCLRLEDPPESIGKVREKFAGRMWHVDRVLTWRRTTRPGLFYAPHIPDAFLLPIRPEPSPVEDEQVEAVHSNGDRQ